MKKGYIVIDQSLCKGCGLCIDVCPKGLIATAKELNIKGYYPAEFKGGQGDNPDGCTGCALCALVCPEIAIEVYRE
ncbi:MAG: 4Fe-4S ferredoxin [Deltaproteobacteria bacterium]|nr:MAG: 4Fe-4S ferredoxin [Deltaproteobacteria bacterium]